MVGPLPFKTVHTSVRPARVAVLVDSSDPDWQHTCLRAIEFYSKLWGGAYNIIVPTDGKVIDDRFWAILEAFDPDYLYAYKKKGEDILLSHPQRFHEALQNQINDWVARFGDSEGAKKTIEEGLRHAWVSNFDISADLQNQIKIRLAPFWFEQWIVEPGGIGAGTRPHFPLTELAKIIINTKHPDRFAQITVTTDEVPKLWYSAVTGAFDEGSSEEMREIGIVPTAFQFDEGDLSHLIEFVVTGMTQRFRVSRRNERLFIDIEGQTPFRLSMIELALYRPTRYQDWTEPLVLVAGNTIYDFCYYYALSRLRDRVAWVLPSITEKALNHENREMSRAETNFIAQARNTEYSPQSQGGVACATYSLSTTELNAVKATLQASPLGKFRSEIREAADISSLVSMPLVAMERDNLQRDIPVQLSDYASISPFPTPKPKNFDTIHPYDHRWITQLTVAQESPPKHPDLGSMVISDRRLTTKERRVGKDGPAYFCPNIAYFGGDIDTVLVRPHLYLPPLQHLLTVLARPRGYECRPSDKGIYAEESISKWGGLNEVAAFLRDKTRKALLEQFLDISKSGSETGVYLDDRRRYLDLPAVKARVGENAAALIDDLVSRQILYRGFIFRCSYCRNSAWFSISEITQEFRCRRCGRSQVYKRENWKTPEEPAWFYKLDELVYQGYRQGMTVSLLALDYLRSTTIDNFSFSTDREFWKIEVNKSEAEVDFFCVTDGILTMGEAKKEDRLAKSTTDENAQISKYRRVVERLAARQVVFATLANVWNATTSERIIAAFKDLPQVKVQFFTAEHLLS